MHSFNKFLGTESLFLHRDARKKLYFSYTGRLEKLYFPDFCVNRFFEPREARKNRILDFFGLFFYVRKVDFFEPRDARKTLKKYPGSDRKFPGLSNLKDAKTLF